MSEISRYSAEDLVRLAKAAGTTIKVIAFNGPDASDDEPVVDEPAFLVWSHEHEAWWKPGRWGYTGRRAEAGRFTEAAASGICERVAYRWHRGAGAPNALPPEVMIPADTEDWQATIKTATDAAIKARGNGSANPPAPTRIEVDVTLRKAQDR